MLMYPRKCSILKTIENFLIEFGDRTVVKKYVLSLAVQVLSMSIFKG